MGIFKRAAQRRREMRESIAGVLTELEIPQGARERLITDAYRMLGTVMGAPEILLSAAREAHDKGLRGREAAEAVETHARRMYLNSGLYATHPILG
jgi:hypothetical protein